MLKTKCFIVGGMILSSSLQATTSKEAKTAQAIAEIELLQKLEEENDKKLKEYEIKEKYELERKVERHECEIKELKRQVERLDGMLDSIRREQILNAPLPDLHPQILYR